MDSAATPEDSALPSPLPSSDVASASVDSASTPLLTTDDVDPESLVHLSDFECALCCCMLFDPLVTDGCGHCFCRNCLTRSLEIKRFCPLCRSPCSMDALTHPTCQIVANLTQRLFPLEYTARRREAEESGHEMRRRAKVPRIGLFVSSSTHFPLAPLQLHIFEPRYRVMISRAMATTERTFVVVCTEEQRRPAQQEPPLQERKEGENLVGAPAPLPAALPAPHPMGVAHVMDPLRFHPPPFDAAAVAAVAGPIPLRVHDGDIGCLVKIRTMRGHADGRSFVDCIGIARVRITNIRIDEESFGLLTGEVETIKDLDEPEEQKEAVELPPQEQPQPEDLEERKEPIDNEGMRNRRSLPDSSSSSSSSSTSGVSDIAATPALAAAAALPSPSVAHLVAECRTLLTQYCELSGHSLERLALMHGGPCPSDEYPTDLTWWLLRAMPDALALKAEALACTNLRRRLQLCVELMHGSCDFARARTQTQTRFVAIIVMLAVIMIWLKQYNYIT